MGFGDEIMAAGQAQRAFEADPSCRVAICEADGQRVRWHPVWLGNPAIADPGSVRRGERVQRIRSGIGCRPYLQYPFTRDTGWRFTDWRANDHRGRIYLTSSELEAGRRLQAQGGYVLVEPSLARQSNPNKAWYRDRWQDLVQACPGVRFVQMLHRDSEPLSGVALLETATFREACGVVASAAAVITTEGGLHHAAAALQVPAVVIFGGCASVQTTGYDGHVNLADPGPPCGRYHPCAHCREAMARITVDQVVSALGSILQVSACA